MQHTDLRQKCRRCDFFEPFFRWNPVEVKNGPLILKHSMEKKTHIWRLSIGTFEETYEKEANKHMGHRWETFVEMENVESAQLKSSVPRFKCMWNTLSARCGGENCESLPELMGGFSTI